MNGNRKKVRTSECHIVHLSYCSFVILFICHIVHLFLIRNSADERKAYGKLRQKREQRSIVSSVVSKPVEENASRAFWPCGRFRFDDASEQSRHSWVSPSAIILQFVL